MPGISRLTTLPKRQKTAEKRRKTARNRIKWQTCLAPSTLQRGAPGRGSGLADAECRRRRGLNAPDRREPAPALADYRHPLTETLKGPTETAKEDRQTLLRLPLSPCPGRNGLVAHVVPASN